MNRTQLGPVWWLLFLGLVAGVGVTMLGSIRTGGYVVAATLALVGLARAVLPTRASVGAAIRSRGTDVAMYLGLAIVVAAIFASLKLNLPPA